MKWVPPDFRPGKRCRRPSSASLCLCLGLWLGPFAGLAFEPVQPVSVPYQTSQSGAGGSYHPSFSGDGRHLVFLSFANNLVTNDNSDPYLDIFVRDITSNTTVLVSVNSSGVGGGDDYSGLAAISSNGQFVVFSSAAGNLVENDTNRAQDIYLRDLAAGVTRLVSIPFGGEGSATGDALSDNLPLSGCPQISGDGRWVVFESYATNLVDLPDTNRSSDVYARDVEQGITYMVSANRSGTSSGKGGSEQPSLSADGSRVAFVSTATDLMPGVSENLGEIYVRDLPAGPILWASEDVAALLGERARCFDPVLSADGRAVVFKGEPTNAPLAQVFHFDMESGLLRLLESDGVTVDSTSKISADGQVVVYDDQNYVRRWEAPSGISTAFFLRSWNCYPGGSDGPVPSRAPDTTPDGSKLLLISGSETCPPYYLVVIDLWAGSTQIVERVPELSLPVLSPNGRWVALENWNDTLATNDLNRSSDILLCDLETGSRELVSERHADRPARTGAGRTKFDEPIVNAGGRWVVFSTFDNVLVPQDTNVFRDLFAADLDSGGIIPVSIQATSPTNNPANPYPKDAPMQNQAPPVQPSLTADGRFLTYVQPAGYAPSPPVEFPSEVYYRDLLTGTNRPMFYFAPFPPEPTLSFDGSWLCFQTGDTWFGTKTNILFYPIVRNRLFQTSDFVLISARASNPEMGGNGDSIAPVFSPDGQWVAFLSQATDLTTNQTTPGFRQLYAWNARLNAIRLVSHDAEGHGLADHVLRPLFSADSSQIVFSTESAQAVYVHFLYRQEPNDYICSNCFLPSITADGSQIVYQAQSETSEFVDIYLKDREGGEIQLISSEPGGTAGGNGHSRSPRISYDGRYVAFLSRASNLVANDKNGFEDLFVRDLWQNTTRLISENYRGTGSGNGPTSQAVLSGDGRTLVFESMAGDLVPGDYNDRRDIFFVRLTEEDSDGDRMADDWEQVHFGSLDRNGSDDWDGDSLSDLEEYQSGTNPADRDSVFKVFSVQEWTRQVYSSTTWTASLITWRAAPGQVYRVDYQDYLGFSWRSLPGWVTAAGTTGSAIDERLPDSPFWPPSARFYRVVLLPQPQGGFP